MTEPSLPDSSAALSGYVGHSHPVHARWYFDIFSTPLLTSLIDLTFIKADWLRTTVPMPAMTVGGREDDHRWGRRADRSNACSADGLLNLLIVSWLNQRPSDHRPATYQTSSSRVIAGRTFTELSSSCRQSEHQKKNTAVAARHPNIWNSALQGRA